MAQQPLQNNNGTVPPLPLAPIAAPVQPGAGQQVGGGPAPLQVPAQYRSFAGLYSDEARDPLRAKYTAVMQRFDAEDPQAQAGATLLQSVVDNSFTPNAFLCCAALHTGAAARVYLIHALTKYPQAPDGSTSPWDGLIFGYLGEMLHDNVTLVTLPATVFNVVNNGVRVLNEDQLTIQIAQLQQDALFPRLTANAANGVTIQTRSMMRLPLKYAPLVLSPRGYTPKEAYAALSEALAQDHVPAISTPILNWLRATLHATGNNNQGAPVTAISLTATFLDEDLINHRRPLLNHLLPNRNAPSQGLEAALTQFATAVTMQTTEDRNHRLARELERDAPTTPSNKFGMLLDSLLNLLDLTEEAQLPEFWHQFSAAKKKQEFSILREALESYARSAQAFVPLAPIVTPKLHADISTVTFLGDHHDDIKTGLQPFAVMDGSEEHRATAIELSRSFGLLFERELGVAFNDLAQFKVPKELRSYPINYFDLEQNLVYSVIWSGHF